VGARTQLASLVTFSITSLATFLPLPNICFFRDVFWPQHIFIPFALTHYATKQQRIRSNQIDLAYS
ncbi:hypothetical protein K503DRAFT_703990, partial [Rhizopogon vinicolor AM-OR11-026]